MIQLRGAFTALITPMKETGEVDYEGFRRLINFQLEAGIDGLVPLGTTGETPTLEQEEKDTLLQIAVKEAKGQVPIIVGTGSNATKHTIEYTKHVKSLGADAALVVTPYYNKPNDTGLLRHFEATAQQGGLPIVVYNIASRTGRNIPAPLMEQVSQIPGIIGVKESSGDITQMGDIIRDVRDRRKAEAGSFGVLSGDDGFTLPLLALGGDGIVSVISNLVPDKIAALTKAGLEGNFAECRRLHYELLPFIKAAFIETNPIPIKTAMTWAGLPGGPVRLPLGPLSKRSEPVLKAALEELGFTLSGF
ncbi:MAG: 4-hydroxy-tetrahydrodipicolinate synthase [Treponema sp.]|jgi:4-hydroxy-tetrahydrodipicolinate synthase|nr:4-hydroxy-tetrahydrodipicolinate synthase [Treponema sp.]